MADHTGTPDPQSFEGAPHTSPTEQVHPPDRGPFASFKNPTPGLKRAGEAAWKVWAEPAAEIPAFGGSRSLVAFTAVLATAILILPLLLSATAGTFRVFGGLLLWTLVSTAVLYGVLFGGLRLAFHKDVDWLGALGLTSVVWLPLAPALFLSSLLGKASGELGAALFGFSVLVAAYFLSLGLRTMTKLTEKAALYFGAATFTLFLGLLLRGIARAWFGAMLPPGAF